MSDDSGSAEPGDRTGEATGRADAGPDDEATRTVETVGTDGATRIDAGDGDIDDPQRAEAPPEDEVGDNREKHVTVVRRSGERVEHGDVFLKHATDAFVVSPDASFPADETTRYSKADLRRVEINQHHSMCFITTATAGDGPTLDVLRGFRDGVLVRSRPGRALVASYETLSPPIARTLARHPETYTARFVRRLVDRCAGLERRRRDADSRAVRVGLATALTLLYVVGVIGAFAGHCWIRAWDRER